MPKPQRPESPAEALPALTGAQHFVRAYRLTLGAWVCAALLQVLLYARPLPDGPPYVEDWSHYFFHALFYEVLGAFLIGAPFLGLWLALYRQSLASRWWSAVHGLQIALSGISLCLNHLDHEMMRFMGLHLTASFVQTYWQLAGSRSVILDALWMDQGGAALAVLPWIAVPAGYVLWGCRSRAGGLPLARHRAPRWLVGVLLVALPLAFTGWRLQRPTGVHRKRKVQPVIVTVLEDLFTGMRDLREPPDLAERIARYQQDWLAESADQDWQFPDPRYPFLRVPSARAAGPEPAAPAWNVIFLQLESFRGWDMGHLRPDLARSATPFLDGLARSPSAAYWTHHLSYGPPTVNSLVAAHCSVVPHSTRFITTSFTYVDLLGFPDVLRRRGYAAELFSASDQDWDNSSWWYRRWYDRLWIYHDLQEEDRPTFRRAAERVRQLGRSGRPFLATIISATNHYPFRSREKALDISVDGSVRQRILDTTHYTDDVVREFVESLRSEPWFDRTLLVILGDHGYNLGEHDGTPGQYNFFKESTWVPLIFHGDHPRLPRGRQEQLACLLDLAPTLADLLGIREPNPWQGHSLLAPQRQERVVSFVKDGICFAETPRFSLALNAEGGTASLYDWLLDPLQRHDVAGRHRDTVQELLEHTHRTQRFQDHLIRMNRIWRPQP